MVKLLRTAVAFWVLGYAGAAFGGSGGGLHKSHESTVNVFTGRNQSEKDPMLFDVPADHKAHKHSTESDGLLEDQRGLSKGRSGNERHTFRVAPLTGGATSSPPRRVDGRSEPD